MAKRKITGNTGSQCGIVGSGTKDRHGRTPAQQSKGSIPALFAARGKGTKGNRPKMPTQHGIRER